METTNNILKNTFALFEEKKIHYFVLRGYEEKESFYNELEADVYVNPANTDLVFNALEELGWTQLQHPLSCYPHQQFWNSRGVHCYKLDILWEIQFGNERYSLNNDNLEIKTLYDENLEFRIPEDSDALKLFFMHTIFDKGFLSNHGRNFLNYLIQRIKTQSILLGNTDLISVSSDLLAKDKAESEKILLSLKKTLITDKTVKSNGSLSFKKKCLHITSLLHRLLSNNTVCFIGIDGSGKSSLLDKIREDLGELVAIQYFGKKDYMFHFLYKFEQKKYLKPLFKILFWVEIWVRYFKCKLTKRKEIVCCDRYPWDNYFFSAPQKKWFNKLLYKDLFIKPKMVFYCKCSTETSLKRKDDIEDVDAFIKMKETLDKAICSVNNLIILDSDNHSILENASMAEELILSTFLGKPKK